MERRIVTPPDSLIRLLSVDWDIDWRGQSVGQTNTGVTKTVVNAMPRWIGSPSMVLRRSQIGAWRAFRASAQGFVGLYRFPMKDRAVFKLTDTGVSDEIIDRGVAFSTGERFSTGQGFRYSPFVSAVGEAARGADVLRVSVSEVGLMPVAGQIMSCDSFPFVVTELHDLGGDIFELGVQMPLRQAISDGDRVQLQADGIFEVVEERSGNPTYGLDLVSRPQLQLREWLR